MSDELIELPEGWEWILFEDITVNNDGKRVPVSSLERKHRQGSFPYYGASGIIDYVDNYLFDGRYLLIAEDGANLLSRTTPIAFEANGKFWVNNHAHVVQVIEGLVLYSYLRYYINSTDLRFYISGSAQPKLNQKNLNCIPIPLPPLNEQKRIVAKIEELNDRTQRAKEALETIPQLCDRFRQSVLAAAFRGDLTADWREQNPDVEPASVLLERTLQEKRDRTKNQLKHNELNLLIESELEELPKGWHWTTFEQVSERVTVGHVGSMKDEYISEGIPFLRSQNVRENRFDPIGLQYISKEFHEKLSKSSLQPGDLVVVRSGSVGITCVIPDNLKEANCSDLVIVKQPKAINAYYGSYYMNSVARSHVNEKQVGVALIHFNTKSMAQLPIPIAPYKEQEEIIGRVQKLFKSADLIEQQYQKAKANLDKLNQSVLAKAFRGELVPQDPDDEPASELLERIRAEREKLNNGKQKSQRTSKRKSKTVEEQGV